MACYNCQHPNCPTCRAEYGNGNTTTTTTTPATTQPATAIRRGVCGMPTRKGICPLPGGHKGDCAQ